MAKKSVIKQKISKTRTSERRAKWGARARMQLLEKFAPVKCKACGAAKLGHTVCPECGVYRGRTVIEKSAKKDNVTTIKA